MTDSPFADTDTAAAKAPKPVRPRDSKGRIIARKTLSGVEQLPDTEPKAAEVAQPVLADGRQRIPFGTRRKKLDYPPIPGFELRFVNDHDGRIEQAIESGWVHVTNKNGEPIKKLVGTAERGGGLYAYLMKIPKEFYDADFAAKQERLNEVDRQIYKGTYKQEAGDERYVPKSGIKIQSRRG